MDASVCEPPSAGPPLSSRGGVNPPPQEEDHDMLSTATAALVLAFVAFLPNGGRPKTGPPSMNAIFMKQVGEPIMPAIKSLCQVRMEGFLALPLYPLSPTFPLS